MQNITSVLSASLKTIRVLRLHVGSEACQAKTHALTTKNNKKKQNQKTKRPKVCQVLARNSQIILKRSCSSVSLIYTGLFHYYGFLLVALYRLKIYLISVTDHNTVEIIY